MKLGVTEIRKINFALKNKFQFEFSDYSFYFLKRQLESYITRNNFRNIDDFLRYIHTCEQIEDNLREELLVPENEMFRDPTMWEYLRDNILVSLKNRHNATVWFPEASSGEELFSFLIMLYENDLINDVRVLVTSSSKFCLKKLKTGVVRSKGYENNETNYKRYNGQNDFGKYFDFIDSKILLHNKFYQNVTFKQHSVWNPIQVNGLKLTIFRNKAIYYSNNFQHKVLKNITSNLIVGSFLILGAKENVRNSLIDLDIDEHNKFEKIFRKVNR
ncbi:MAG: hypothetical protein KAI79_02115 [Bacteroidales bacterium]|nr:hypothetical protein [Bacteroidales bacterium]